MLGLLILSSAFAGPALAQVAPYPGVTPLDQHRYENQRLRAEADRRETQARLYQLEAQGRLREVEAARQPPLYVEPAYRPLSTPEQERAARQAATARREAIAAGTGQIDAWLDRSRR